MPVYRCYGCRVYLPRPLWHIAPADVESEAESDITFSLIQAGEPLPAWTNVSWSVVREWHGREWTMAFSTPVTPSQAVLQLHTRRQSDEATIIYGQNAAQIVIVWRSSVQHDSEDIWLGLSSWVMGAVLGYAMCLRGLPTLHGSVVAVEGRAIGLLGVSGAGKSTLAAAFVAAGHTLVADDHLVIDQISSRWYVLPGPPRLRLWPASLAVLGAGDPESALATDGDGKYHFEPPLPMISAQPLPLAAIYVLAPRDPERNTVKIESLDPAASLNALMNQRFCMTPFTPTHTADSLAALSKLVPQVPVRMLYRPNGLETLPEIVDAIHEDVRTHGR